MMIRKIFLLIAAMAVAPVAKAQSNAAFEEFKAQQRKEFNAHKKAQSKRYEEFRRKRNEEYADFMRQGWSQFKPRPVITIPKHEEVKPVPAPKGDIVRPAPKPLPFNKVITPPLPQPQPEPVEPIEEVVENTVLPANTRSFEFFGTKAEVRLDQDVSFQLASVGEQDIADAWLKLSEPAYTNLVFDCLKIRREHALCDWAYLLMLKDMSEAICGKQTDEAVLLMAYVYCQSGYKMRLCRMNGRLQMLFASKHTIFQLPYFAIGGEDFYAMDKVEGETFVCAQSYPQESPLSLLIATEQKFATGGEQPILRKAERYADVRAEVSVGKNLLDFYTSYPTSMIGYDIMTRWAMYANTPLATSVKEQLYPALEAAVAGLGKVEAVEKLLNFVQTGFEYEYDDKVWGDDRAFFAEESLHYPYCDCEDRSILFSRLVRDILHLEVVLVLYPGHLATAVNMGDCDKGDYILLNEKKYVVCDPTYIGASTGMTMPGMDNVSAQLIVLE